MLKRSRKAGTTRMPGNDKLEPGEQVLVLLPTESNKLLDQWQGPYRVVKKIGKVDYLHDR